MFACVILEEALRDVAADGLVSFAREWTPRVEVVRPGLVVLDAAGMTRLFGTVDAWARQLADAARARGWRVRAASADTRVAAILLALARPGVTVVPPGGTRAALAPLPLAVLAAFETDTPSAPAAAPRGRRLPASPARNYRLAPAPQDDLNRVQGQLVVDGTRPPQYVGSGDRWTSAGAARDVGLEADPTDDQNTHGERAMSSAIEDLLETLGRWGLRTLGDLAALPVADVAARLGDPGRRWHARACGIDWAPLVDAGEARRFEARLDLEWPIDGLEPLSFVLARLLEPLCAELQHDERGAVVVETRLDLVSKTTHARVLQLPAPMNDPRVLRTLILLDLEAHPPDAAIDRVHVRLEPMPGRRVQFSLLRRPLPAPDQIATLNARLSALMGAGRCGSPVLLDTHRPGAFAMAPFAPQEADAGARRARRLRATDDVARGAQGAVVGERGLPQGMARDAADETRLAMSEPGGLPTADHQVSRMVLRRFRRPITVRVTLQDAHPVRLNPGLTGLAGGPIIECAGPWRTSGAWWRVGPSPDRGAVAPGRPWDRDEWDVAIRGGPIYRLSRIVNEDRWVVEGIWD